MIYVGYVTLFDVCVRDNARISVFSRKISSLRSVCIWDSSILYSSGGSSRKVDGGFVEEEKGMCYKTWEGGKYVQTVN